MDDLIKLLWDRILQFAASFQATSIEPDEGNETDEERLQRALDMSMMDGDDNDEIGSFQDTSIEPDEGNETDEERLQRALDVSMMDGNDNDEIGSFQDTSIEPDEGNEINEERLQRALDMSMMNENSCEETVASREYSSNIAGRPILFVGSFYCWVANGCRQITSRL